MYISKKRLIASIVLNSCIVFFVVLCLFLIIFDVRLFGSLSKLTPDGNNPFAMFTTDSNLLLGLFSIPILVYQILVLTNKRKEVPFFAYILKYVGVVGTSLTLLTVLFYLSPILGSGFYRLFLDTNFFYHLVIPVLGIVSFIFFEYDHYEPISFKFTFVGIIPMVVYSTYYCINAFTHIDENGNIPWKYDVYTFASKGVGMAIVMIFIMLAFVYFISFLLYLFNKLSWKKHLKENKDENNETL